MGFTLSQTEIDDLVVLEPAVFGDGRGFFFESYNKADFAAAGLHYDFIQDNHSRSAKGVLRGVHYQNLTAPLAKLVRCTQGAILDVCVDLRVGSPTFGKWVGVELTADNRKQLMVPVGFGHAFATLSDFAEVQYKCSGPYSPEAEGTLAWDDPDVGVKWPLNDPTLSEKDQTGQSLQEYLKDPAFRFGKTS